jgi:hypothetical protein
MIRPNRSLWQLCASGNFPVGAAETCPSRARSPERRRTGAARMTPPTELEE